MADINSLSKVDNSNTARFPENQNPSTVNDGARALEGMVARWNKDSVESDVDSTGSANAYIVAANRTIAAYYDGMRQGFHANFACTGASTLSIDGVGAKTIKKNHDQDLASGDIEANQYVEVIYSASDDTFQMLSPTAASPASSATSVIAGNGLTGGGTLATDRTIDVAPGPGLSVTADAVLVDPSYFLGFISGLVPSNNGSDANNDIDISAGVAVDATGAKLMKMASAITKRLDAAWAVGTNQGGLDTSSEATSTWYALWLIMRSDTGVVDWLFSASFSSPTMPANYDYKRYIGAVYNNGSSNIQAFKAIEIAGGGLYTDWSVPVLDVNASRTVTRTNYTLSVPPKVVMAHVANGAQDANGAFQWLSNPNITDTAPSATGTATALHNSNNLLAIGSAMILWIVTNASGQIALDADTATGAWFVRTFGWQDFRRP